MKRTRIPPHFRSPHLIQTAALWLLVASGQAACSSADPGEDSPTGGTASSGGAASTGGSVSSGGAGSGGGAPTGGVSGTGGGTDTPTGGAASGTGGLSGTGGFPDGSGGAAGSGGSIDAAGGSEATGGSDGSGGAAGFQPCPQSGPCKILPLGDSITRGYPDQDSYRVHLFELAVEDDHEITFVGTRMGGPQTAAGQTFPRNHEGIDGERVEQIANRVPSPGLNDMPHIILVHAGTNDLTQQNANVSTHMASLLDELIADAPDALIAVARVIPIFYMLDGVNSYNDSVEALAEERADAGAHIIVVDHFENYPQADLGDTVHPNAAGYERMAQKWYDAIETYLR